MKTTPVIILALAVLLIVGGTIWFLQTGPRDSAPEVAVATPAPVPKASSMPPPAVIAVAPAPSTAAGETAPVVLPEATPATAEWENRIDQILNTQSNSQATETETAQLLINMLPTLPPEGQATAAQHISNLILDKDYQRVLPLVRNASLAPEVHDVLFMDLMNRGDSVKLPALLEVAKIPNHPFHDEALTDLQIFLDQDNESNWGKWDTAVKDYLKKQATEDAAAGLPAEPVAPQ